MEKYTQRALATLLGTNHTKLQRLAKKYPETAPAIVEGDKKYYDAAQVEVIGKLLAQKDKVTPEENLFDDSEEPSADDTTCANFELVDENISETPAAMHDNQTDNVIEMPAEEPLPKVQENKKLTKITVPADRLPKKLFNLDAETFRRLLAGEAGYCKEFTDKKSQKPILTPYFLKNAEGYLNDKPLTPFDREVLFMLIGAYYEGFRVASYHTTLDALTGGNKNYGRDEQYEAIKAAVDKLRSTIITIDTQLIRKASPKKYDNTAIPMTISDYLLPARLIEATYNGQKTLIIEMHAESPLMILARDIKQQVQTYDLTPLNIPKIKNTPLVIVIKHELRRWVDGVQNRGLPSTLTLKTFFENIGLGDADKWKRQDARKAIVATMNHFVAEKLIKSWDWKRKGQAYDAITLTNITRRTMTN